MKKKVLAFLAATSLMTSLSMAAPQTDYSPGKTTIDLTMRNTKEKYTGGTYDKKNNIDWGVTTGLGNDWAIQYRQFNPKSKWTTFNDRSGTILVKNQLKTREINVLRKVTDNVSVYAGIMGVQGVLDYVSYPTLKSSSKNKLQLGLVGSTKIADKLIGYASVGAGKDLTAWQIGAAYEVAPNMDFNVDYRQIKAKMNFRGFEPDGEAKGLGFGISYKF